MMLHMSIPPREIGADRRPEGNNQQDGGQRVQLVEHDQSVPWMMLAHFRSKPSSSCMMYILRR